VGENPRNLREVIEIVSDPGCQELAQRDDAQLRMSSPPIQVRIGEVQ
jgi:hypothetical protein